MMIFLGLGRVLAVGRWGLGGREGERRGRGRGERCGESGVRADRDKLNWRRWVRHLLTALGFWLSCFWPFW